MKLFVGNFVYTTTVPELKELFSKHGSVLDVRIIHDQFTRQSKCFGYVRMKNERGGKEAIEALHGKDFNNQDMVVKKAKKI